MTSDCGAVENVWTPEPNGHGYTDKVKATALSVIAGTDIDCGSQYSNEFAAVSRAAPGNRNACAAATGTGSNPCKCHHPFYCPASRVHSVVTQSVLTI